MVVAMGRPRGFDEQAVTAAAARLFAGRVYDGVSVDDLVQQLGVHRNSLYKTFGSKRGLYLAALRWYLRNELAPLADRLAGETDLARVIEDEGLDLLLLAAMERAPVDTEVAEIVLEALHLLEQALHQAPTTTGSAPEAAVNALLGQRLRARATASADVATPPTPAPNRG
jgi:TetR/AcrR family transcriptional regulator, transcriptional repressor for nem operon